MGKLLNGSAGGVLACHVPPGLVDEVLEVTGRAQRRFRALPSRLGIYFVLALCLFSGSSYGSVIAKVVAGRRDLLGAAGWRLPSSTALTKLRRRLGEAPFELLFRRLSGSSVSRSAPWSHVFGLLLVAWDGTNVDLADSSANAAAFGRPSCKKGAAGNPQSRPCSRIATARWRVALSNYLGLRSRC
ncbi:transposase domain-containing protein [Streptomyces umbrinus]|uniref:transposase domain-containing protein n=1 Tax=Streptomyces umbrinus TaxID=67370 RepID=UPI003C2E5A2E